MTENADMFGFEHLITVEKDPTESGLEGMRDSAYIRYCKRHYALIDKVSEIGLPLPGQQLRLITRRTFNAIQFLDVITATECIEHLYIAIYSINFYAAQILIEHINEGRIARCTVLMSNLRNAAHREKEELVKKMFVDHPRIEIFFCSSHAKTFSCKTNLGNYYTLEGSGNLAFNSRVEQYVIDNDEGMFDFTRTWMIEIRDYLAGRREYEYHGFTPATPAT